MENITTGHWIFAGLFVIAFIIGITYAYRKDLQRVGQQYRKVWLILLALIGIYFFIFLLTRIV